MKYSMARILVLVSFKIFPARMGGQKNVVLFYESLRNYHTIFFALSNDNLETGSFTTPTKTLFSNKKIFLNILVIRELVKFIKEEKIDLIIAEHSYTGWIAFLLKKLTSRPFIIHSHNIESERFKHLARNWWRTYQIYEKWIHRKATFNFFISEHDKNTAIQKFRLSEEKCAVIPYGINVIEKIPDAKNLLRKIYGLKQKYIFHFNGTLDYRPNLEAVKTIIQQINPRLRKSGLDYIFIISGERLSTEVQEQIINTKEILHIGFVDNINLLYQGCDVFVNPITENAGVKTKIIEALANNCTIVTTRQGFGGIPTETYGSKVVFSKNGDWEIFSSSILEAIKNEYQTTQLFYEYFLWDKIAGKAAKLIDELVQMH